MSELNKYSKTVTQDPTQPAAQAMLHAIGLTTDDLKKPQIGIASTGFDGNPCNMHLNGLASSIKKNINEYNQVGLVFHTIGVSAGCPRPGNTSNSPNDLEKPEISKK